MPDMKRREFIALVAASGLVLAAKVNRARGQQSAMPVIGFMSARSSEDSVHLLEAFRRGLEERGFVEGRNVVIEYRWARGDYDRLPDMAADLVSRRVNVLTAVGGDPSPRAAKRATASIPIVFGMGGDPVKDGLVESFNRPGGNVTGMTLMTTLMEPKRFGLLRDLVPDARLVSVLVNPNFAPSARQLQQIEEAAGRIGQRLVVAQASTDAELDAGFAALVKRRADALLVAADPYFDTRRDRIVGLARRERLPAIYQFREYVLAGGLLSYGISITDAYRQFGVYTAPFSTGPSLPIYRCCSRPSSRR
jgi:putative ABC transport system substrate-binding protein